MAGVIDERGVQWEHCSCCGKLVRLQDLGYQPKSHQHPYGRDLCLTCANALPQAQLRKVQPAVNWIARRS